MTALLRQRAIAFAALCLLADLAGAQPDTASLLQPARADIPLAHPIATNDIAAPPFSLLADRPVRPAYVAGLPGLREGTPVTDDFGRKAPKYDGVLIRKSRVENGQVVIPPGGLAYLEDTWGGEVALRGEPIPVLGKTSTYVDDDMSIVVKRDVTIPAGQSVVVGGQVYHYYATVGHEQTASHALHVRTIAGTDWEWAFGSPVLSTTQTQWWNGTRFNQLYNQGQAREVTRERMVFDWISGVRMDRLLLADQKVFVGAAASGDRWQVGQRTVRVASVDAAAGTVTIEVRDGDRVTLTKTLGPVDQAHLIEDTTARKRLVFEAGDIVGFLSPWPAAFSDGRANLKIYAQAYSLRYGADFAADPRFAIYPIGCPTGHNFGFMLVNKSEIRLAPGQAFDGPGRYFKVAVDQIDGNNVTGWHVEDGAGQRSRNLGGSGVTNVDLVLGQGRIDGQAILKDVGREMLVRNTTSSSDAAEPGRRSGLGAGMIVGMLLALAGACALAFEMGRRGRA